MGEPDVHCSAAHPNVCQLQRCSRRAIAFHVPVLISVVPDLRVALDWTLMRHVEWPWCRIIIMGYYMYL